MNMECRRSIVFITGTFLANDCWDEWIVYFENKGYDCLAPAWPNKYAPPEELRNRHPDAAVASNRLAALIHYFAAIIKALPEQPIIIGHSLGGLIVQLLLQRGLGVAGVAMHSFPPRGIPTLWKAMGFFTSTRKTYLISFREWKYFIANGVSCEGQKESYYAYAIPESKQIVRDIFCCQTKINFRNAHPPLLFTAGTHDRLIPAAVNEKNYKKYNSYAAVTHFKQFAGTNHLVFEPSPWKEEAEYIFAWLSRFA
jgi:pimeloyl-ACP methyl ester carboxylesterase